MEFWRVFAALLRISRAVNDINTLRLIQASGGNSYIKL